MIDTVWTIVFMSMVLVYVYFKFRIDTALVIQSTDKKVTLPGKRIYYIVAPGISVFFGWASLYMLIFYDPSSSIQYSWLLVPSVIGGCLATTVSYLRVRLLKNFTDEINQMSEQNSTE